MNENLVILTRPFSLPNHSRGSLRGRQKGGPYFVKNPENLAAAFPGFRWASPKHTLVDSLFPVEWLQVAQRRVLGACGPVSGSGSAWRHLMLVSPFGPKNGWLAFDRGRVKITPTKIGFSSKLGQKGNYWLSLPRGFCLVNERPKK